MRPSPASARTRFLRWLPPPARDADLSWRQVLFILLGCVPVLGLSYFLRHFVYPWLGLPVPPLGISGFAPFVFGVIAVGYVLFSFEYFLRRPWLLLGATLVLGNTLAMFLLWFGARIWM